MKYWPYRTSIVCLRDVNRVHNYLGSERISDQCTYKHRYVGYIMSNDSLGQ